MANLTLKGIPDHLVERLKADAKRQGRSLQAHVVTLLEKGAIESWSADPYATLQGERSRREPAFDEADVHQAHGREYDL